MASTFTYQYINQLVPTSDQGPENQRLGQLVNVTIAATFESANPFEAVYLTDTGFQPLFDLIQLTTVDHQLIDQLQNPNLPVTITTTNWLTTTGQTTQIAPAQPVFVNGRLPLVAVLSHPSQAPVSDQTAQVLITPGDGRLFATFAENAQFTQLNLVPLLNSIQRLNVARTHLFKTREAAFTLELNNPLVTTLQQSELALVTQLLTAPETTHALNGLIFDALTANDAYCLELQQRAGH